MKVHTSMAQVESLIVKTDFYIGFWLVQQPQF